MISASGSATVVTLTSTGIAESGPTASLPADAVPSTRYSSADIRERRDDIAELRAGAGVDMSGMGFAIAMGEHSRSAPDRESADEQHQQWQDQPSLRSKESFPHNNDLP